MSESRHLYRPRRPRGISNMDWLAANSHDEPGPLATPCRIWEGITNAHGYGQLTIGRRVWLIHRLAWVERHGELPPETPCVLHRCDVPLCFADDHLWPGTNADNLADMAAKGRGANQNTYRTHCRRGHIFDAANTYLSRSGRRHCRACRV